MSLHLARRRFLRLNGAGDSKPRNASACHGVDGGMIILKADPSDGVATGWTYSIAPSGQDLLVTTDVVEAVKMLEDLGVEKPEDLVDQVRKQRFVEIRSHREQASSPPRRVTPMPRGARLAKKLGKHSDKR